MSIEEKKELINKIVKRVESIGFQNFLQSNHRDGNLIPDIYECFRNVMGRHYKVGCKSCFTDCFIELRSMLKNDTLMKIEEKEYRLKKGVVLDGFAFKIQNIECTDDNLTTELAEKHLSLDPSRIIYFSKFPEDWENRVGVIKVEKEDKKEDKVKDFVVVDYPTRKIMLTDLKIWEVKNTIGASIGTNELKKLWLENKK